jgi:hypothetical protein
MSKSSINAESKEASTPPTPQTEIQKSEPSVVSKALTFQPLENFKDKLLQLKFLQSILVMKN